LAPDRRARAHYSIDAANDLLEGHPGRVPGQPGDRRNHRNRTTPAHPSRPETAYKELKEYGMRIGCLRPPKGGQMEPLTTGYGAIYHDDSLVHNWRVSQLKRLGISGTLAEMYADHIDWHQVARLVRDGCAPRLALRIVR
jgi:hypothetical protein